MVCGGGVGCGGGYYFCDVGGVDVCIDIEIERGFFRCGGFFLEDVFLVFGGYVGMMWFKDYLWFGVIFLLLIVFFWLCYIDMFVYLFWLGLVGMCWVGMELWGM